MSHDRWAGPPPNQGATAPAPEPKTSPTPQLMHGSRMKFSSPTPVPQVAPRPLIPADGPLPERRRLPTTADNPRNTRVKETDHGKAHHQNTSRCPQLHRAHPRLLATGKPGLHHPSREQHRRHTPHRPPPTT